MKKQLFLLLFIPFLSFSQKAEKIRGNKDVTIKETKVDSFSTINIGGKFKINLIEGEPKVKIETDDNLHEVIEFSVNDAVLSFGINKRIISKKTLNITVYYPDILNSIETSNDAELNSLSTLSLENLILNTGGSSKVNLDIKTSTFNFTNHNKSRAQLNVIADSSIVILKENSKLKGTLKSPHVNVSMIDRASSSANFESDSLNLNISNRASFISKDLISKNCIVTTQENSKATINVSNELTITANGNSTIYIYNDPKIIIKDFTDTATLNKRKIK